MAPPLFREVETGIFIQLLMTMDMEQSLALSLFLPLSQNVHYVFNLFWGTPCPIFGPQASFGPLLHSTVLMFLEAK